MLATMLTELNECVVIWPAEKCLRSNQSVRRSFRIPFYPLIFSILIAISRSGKKYHPDPYKLQSGTVNKAFVQFSNRDLFEDDTDAY